MKTLFRLGFSPLEISLGLLLFGSLSLGMAKIPKAESHQPNTHPLAEFSHMQAGCDPRS